MATVLLIIANDMAIVLLIIANDNRRESFYLIFLYFTFQIIIPVSPWISVSCSSSPKPCYTHSTYTSSLSVSLDTYSSVSSPLSESTWFCLLPDPHKAHDHNLLICLPSHHLTRDILVVSS